MWTCRVLLRQSHMQLHTVAKLDISINQKIFVNVNIHVLNFRVNKLSWVSYENILRQKFCQVEITAHVLLIKRLLCTYTSLVCYRNSWIQSDLCIMLPIVIRGKCVCMRENHFQLITPFVIHVNTGHVNGYIWETVMYVHITWICYWAELGLCGVSA